jgi:uncharacterized repeat protein (TIGR01451 family)
MRISRVTGNPRGAALATVFAAISLVLISARPLTAEVPATEHGPADTIRSLDVPGLSISLSDGRTTIEAGDRVTYTVRLRNSGAVSVPRVEITQTLPAELKFISATGNGVTAAGEVVWHAGLPAGGQDTVRVTAQLTQTPAHLQRLAAVACATLQGSSEPTVCAAHLDQLPADAAAVGRARQAATSAAGFPVAYLAGLCALAAAVLAVIAARVTRLRRRPRHSA